MNTTDIVVPPVTIATSSTGTHTEKDEDNNDHPGEGRKEGGRFKEDGISINILLLTMHDCGLTQERSGLRYFLE